MLVGIYDAVIKGIDKFFLISGKDPGMAMIILAGLFYFLDKITKHFNKEKYKNYTLRETLNHPREMFGLVLMGVLFITGLIIITVKIVSD